MSITDKEIEQIASTNLPNNHFNPYMTAPEYFQQEGENMWIRFKLKAFYPLLCVSLLSTLALLLIVVFYLF
jgi:hypothetical protein